MHTFASCELKAPPGLDANAKLIRAPEAHQANSEMHPLRHKPNRPRLGALEGGWYVDLVVVAETAPKQLVVHDLYVDIVVPPRGRRYEVLDLDELADALRDGSVDALTAAGVLRNAQRFIDKHLRDLDREAPDSWPDFPPAAIRDLVELPPFGVG